MQLFDQINLNYQFFNYENKNKIYGDKLICLKQKKRDDQSELFVYFLNSKEVM